MLTLFERLVEPQNLGVHERSAAGYKLQECLGFCLRAALSQIPDEELDLDKGTCGAEHQRCSPDTGEA